jgi:dTDP-4-amino-4,6-dideoxygalactose transaminase
MDPLMALANRHELAVIEDATEGLGANYRGRHVGHLAHISCLSFNGNKIITTGGGGMLVTDNDRWAATARYLTTQAKDDPIEYEHHEIGYNYRLTNVLAAFGVAQFEQLAAHVDAKRRIAERYAAALEALPGLTGMREAPWARSTCWMYTVLVDPLTFGMSSRPLLHALADGGVQTRPLWQPLHRSPAHRGAYAVGGSVADRLHRDGLSLPCSVGLSDEAQKVVIDSLSKAHRARATVTA